MPVHTHGPAITGCLRVVEHQASGGALAARLLELVQPSAVICHVPSAEQRCVIVAGIVHHGNHYLALYVNAGIVVPAVFRGVDSESAENVFRLGDLHLVGRPGGPNHQVVRIKQVSLLLAPDAYLVSHRLGGDGQHLERLEPAPAKGGLQAQLFQLARQVVYGDVLVFGHGFPSPELIGGQGLNPPAHQLFVIRPRGCRHLRMRRLPKEQRSRQYDQNPFHAYLKSIGANMWRERLQVSHS